MPAKRPATSPAMSPSIAKKTRKSLTLEIECRFLPSVCPSCDEPLAKSEGISADNPAWNSAKTV
ncbi:hypothetical protein E2C01_023533 [Portunus trituberculatus]|uniref:Uncharacterized protein n=1 Tax=Portunus trituberculatus TaxID=210409 RepID=A0A5B7E8G3_PORTR|nr:hypothetical protein [Portunus trituberculatus]